MDLILKKEKGHNSIKEKIGKYTLETVIKKQTDSYSFSSGIYRSTENIKFFIKSINFNQKKSSYYNLLKEKELITSLAVLFNKKENKSLFRIPMIKSLHETKHSLALIEEYIKGKDLSTFSVKKQLAILTDCLKTLERLSTEKNIVTMQSVVPTRNKLYVFITFSFFIVILILRDAKNIFTYLKLSLVFVTYYVTENIFDSEKVIAHRDLHTKNILVADKNYFLIDPEVVAITEKHTDLAILVRSLVHVPSTDLGLFFENFLHTNSDKKRFLALSLYYSVQIAAMSTKGCYSYNEGMDYIHIHFNNIRNLLSLKKYSLATRIIQGTLSILYVILTKFKRVRISKSLILCYHNTGYDNWNFTIRPEVLDTQLDWIKSNATIAPIAAQLRPHTKPTVSISFDDGYKNMLSLTQPIIKKHKITPILFILGNAKKANRIQLDNDNPLLTTEEIKKLINHGWEIGYHTNTHADLRVLSDKQLYQEIIKSKSDTEKKLGIEINYFAYPRGIYDKRVDTLMETAPYTAAFTVDGGHTEMSPDTKHIQRICYEGELELYQFKALLTHQGLTFYSYFMKALKIKETYSSKIKKFRLFHNYKKFVPMLSYANLNSK